MAVTLDVQHVALASAVVGVALHLGYFIRGEHHLESLRLVQLALISPVAVFVAAKYYLAIGDKEATQFTIASLVSFYGALFGSIVTYRLFFHRLRNFPGPFWAKATKLYHVSLIARRKNNWLVRDAWHQKYGDIVRIGKRQEK